VVAQNLPDHAADVASRVGVVTDVSDSAGPERPGHEREQSIAHGMRDPGIEPVGGDVVEAARRGLPRRQLGGI
jgi:hypothetical protein